MTFDEIVAAVTAITNRPDLASSIESAVQAATLKAHASDYFFRDLVEVAVEFDEARYIQTFDPLQVVPTYRQVKYIRLWEGGLTGTYGKFLKHIHTENSVDSYGSSKLDVFYMAGAYLQIRGVAQVSQVLFGAYVNPVVAPTESYSSWIADLHPYAIINEAARRIFVSVAYPEQAAAMQQLVAEDYRSLMISNVDTVPS